MITLFHEHSLKILKYSAKNIWLLIFPLIRGIKAFTPDVNQIYLWIRGAWFDILIILVILLFGYIKWISSKIFITETSIIHKKGLLFNSTTEIPFKNLSSVTFEHSFYLRPFKAVRFFADTRSGSVSSNDMKLLLSIKNAEDIEKNISLSSKKQAKYSHKPSIFLILIFSALFSSSLSGVIYVGTFFFQGGEIAQDIIKTSINLISSEASKWIIAKLPPVIWSIVVFMISTWFISFLINLLRYSGFSIKRNSEITEIKSGFITKRNFTISMKKINFIDIRQNIIMKLFRVMSVNISCSGYGSDNKKNMPVLVPLITKKMLKNNLSDIIHAHFSIIKQYHPKPTSFWQYIWSYVIIAVLILPLTSLFAYFFPSFYRLAVFITIMAEIPTIWSIIIRITALFTNGITINKEYIQINYSKRFVFHTVIAQKNKIVKYYIKQSPFQRLFKKCTICIYLGCENTVKHSVKAIAINDAYKIFESIRKD